MDPGSDPARDDYGLPPADVDIPDDARELDRDVLAYHRELRVRRRRDRVRKIAAPLARHGLVIPLIAACLAFTLLGGSLLSIFTGRQPAARYRAQTTASTHPSPRAPLGSNKLPNAQVLVNGKTEALRALAPAMLAWVPGACACAPVLQRLAAQAASAHVRIYFVATAAAIAQVASLAGQYHGRLVQDTSNALGRTYGLHRLSAVLAGGNGVVPSQDILRTVTTGAGLAGRLRALAATSAQSPTPGS